MRKFTPTATTLRNIQCTLLALPDDAANNIAVLAGALAHAYNPKPGVDCGLLNEIREAIARLDLSRVLAALEALEPSRAAERGEK